VRGVKVALTALPEADQLRLGLIEDWNNGPHQLTYRQTERTFGLVAKALSNDQPGGAPSQNLARFCNDPLEASIPGQYKNAAPPWRWTGPTWKPSPAHPAAAPANAPTCAARILD